MRIVVLGSGGREHALAWRLAKDAHDVCALPGSDAIPNSLGGTLSDHEAVVSKLRERRIDLVVIGPEAPLAEGLSDRLRSEGFAVAGPSKAASALETSKAFAKAFMRRHGVTTAGYAEASSASDAHERLRAFDGRGVVVKYDGLAAGKGVVVCDDVSMAQNAVAELAKQFGDDAPFVLEERLQGPEVSLIVLTDGRTVVKFPLARDHKRLLDADRGPNTGGMGVLAPVPNLAAEVLSAIDRDIVFPTLRGIASDGLLYRGFLYFGIMLTPEGPKLLEYNARFGDPEAEALLPLVEGDFGRALLQTAKGDLAEASFTSSRDASVCLVLASPEYPARGSAGLLIEGLTGEGAVATGNAVVFHSGTKKDARGAWVTSGGRVLCVVGRGASLRQARETAYAAARSIRFEGVQLRSDIGEREASV